MICQDAIILEKLRYQNFFLSHQNKKRAFSNFSGLKSVIFEKLRFRDKFVVYVRPDRRNEAVFSSLEGPSILRTRSTLPDNEYNEYKYFKVC